MKIELLSKPSVNNATIAVNMPAELVSEFDLTKRTIGDVVQALSSKFFAMTQHLHYAFYFHLPPDYVTEILCYSDLKVSRDQAGDLDEGILSGSVEQFFKTALVFCRKDSDKLLRYFFNTICNILEADQLQLPFRKVDLGDQTYATKML